MALRGASINPSGGLKSGASAMVVMFAAGLVVIHVYEVVGNPALGPGASVGAKEQRFGARHDSFMPLSGLVMLVFMAVAVAIFGGVGAELCGMLLYVVLAVSLAGVMVGGAIAIAVPQALAAVKEAGPHGFSESLYA